MLVKGLQKRTQSKRRPEKTGQIPSDGKVSFTEMKFRLISGSSVQEISYPHLFQTGPLYRELGVVISSVTSPRFTEAKEFGYNFLNG